MTISVPLPGRSLGPNQGDDWGYPITSAGCRICFTKASATQPSFFQTWYELQSVFTTSFNGHGLLISGNYKGLC